MQIVSCLKLHVNVKTSMTGSSAGIQPQDVGFKKMDFLLLDLKGKKYWLEGDAGWIPPHVD